MKFYRDKFKELRKKARFSVKEFCSTAGIVRSTLWEWESGKRTPSEASIRVMAGIINVRVDEVSDLKSNEDVVKDELSESVEGWLSLAGGDVGLRQSKFDGIVREISVLNKEMNQATVIINALLSTMHTMFYVKDARLNYITANDIFLQNISLNSDYRVVGENDSSFFPSKEAKSNTEEDRDVLLAKQSVVNREGYIPGSRKKKWGLISKIPIRDSVGKITGLVGTFVDITDRKKAEEIRTLLEAALNNSLHAVWLQYVSPKYKLFYISESVVSLYGYPAERFLNEKDFWYNVCVHPDDKKLLERDWIYGKTTTPGKRIFRIIRPDGKIRWIESFMVNTNIENYIAFVEKDVTEREEQMSGSDEKKIRVEIASRLSAEGVDADIISKCTGW